jgi:anti-anti-sigma factor
MTTETDLQAGLVKVTGPMSIYEATALREAMLAAFDSPEGVTLDLGEVTECDTAGVQLICSARITARKRGTPLTIRAVSDAVTQSMEGVGIDPFDILNP